jgi:hypothetical protein
MKYKTIPGFLDYAISDTGVVVSRKYGKTRVLKQTPDLDGYPKVCLYVDGVQHFRLVHRLVWETWRGPIPDGVMILHGDGNDKTNASLSYLRLGDAKANAVDMVRDGTDIKGSKRWCAKLTEVQVKWIKQRLADGMLHRQLAKFFDVSLATITNISVGRTWKHV